MGDLIRFQLRDPYSSDLLDFLDSPVAPPSGTQISYRCADRQTAGWLSRRLRADVRRSGWRLTVKQFRETVYVWKNLTPKEQAIVDRAIGEAASRLLPFGRLRLVR